jgi:ABC-2 type transport system permease protein
LVCGLFVPRAAMAEVLRWFSDLMPLSYAVQALQRVASGTDLGGQYWRDAAILVGVTLLALVLAAATLPRSSR